MTGKVEHDIQTRHGFAQKRGGKMLVSGRHPEVFVPSQLSDSVEVCALHSQPARRRVAEVMETRSPWTFTLSRAWTRTLEKG